MVILADIEQKKFSLIYLQTVRTKGICAFLFDVCIWFQLYVCNNYISDFGLSNIIVPQFILFQIILHLFCSNSLVILSAVGRPEAPLFFGLKESIWTEF